MRRITKQRIINIILIVISIIIFIWNIFFGYIDNIIFATMLIFISIGLGKIYRHIIFKSDSGLWLGITFLSLAITYIIMVYLKVNIRDCFALFLISPIIASVFIGLIFKDALQLKVILYIVNCMIFSILYSVNIIPLWMMFLFSICGGITLTILLTILPRVINKAKSKG